MIPLRFIIELGLFYFLIALLVIKEKRAFPYFHKSKEDWIIDLSGLLVQGFFIPLIGISLLYMLYGSLVPELKGALSLPSSLSFLLNFILVDYIYYWFHRLYHKRSFWFIHAIHHSAPEMDILNTSRNSLLTHFFLPYLWINSWMLYWLSNPTPYLLAISVTAMLDLWRHSTLYPKKAGLFTRALESVFISPRHHSWHHSRYESRKFFGANFIWWDQLHGTSKQIQDYPSEIGIPLRGSFQDKFFTPWKLFKRSEE